MRYRTRIIPFSLLLCLIHPSAAQDGTVSVYSDPALGTIRPCAATCITRVPGYIGCPVSPILNRCFCRTDLTDIARTSLYGCVSLWCNGGVAMDGVALTSVYTRYCNGVLGNQAIDTPVTNTGVSTSGSDGSGPVVQTAVETITTKVASFVTLFTGTITTEVNSERTVVVYSTITTVLTDETLGQLADEYRKEQGSSGGLDKGYQVAIAVGVVAIVIIILLLFMNKIRRRWFGYQGPYSEPPLPPMGGIQGTGQHNLGQPQFYR